MILKPKLFMRFRGIGLGAASVAFLLGVIVLTGWILRDIRWSGALSGLISGTAVFLLVGMAGFFARKSALRAQALETLLAEQARALKASEDLGRLSISSASQGIYDMDIRTGEVHVSPEYAVMLGYDPDEYSLTLDRFFEQLHPDDRDDTRTHYQNYLAGKAEEYRVEFRERTKFGEWKWILSVGQFIEWDAEGNPTRMLGTHTDITEHVETKIELARLARFPEENPNPVMRLSEDGDLLYANDASSFLLSHGLRELAAFGETVSRALESGVPENVEMKLYDSFYMITVAPVSELGVVNVYGMDITARQNAFESLWEAEERLKQTVLELTRSNQDLEQFAYVSSHDLQEPLRMVSNYVQLIAKRYKGQLDDEADEFIAYAVDGVRRMSELIDGLLEYSRVQTSMRPVASINCNELLDNVLHDMSRAIQGADATVSAGPLPVITGDRIQIGRVFQNLIANAIKFSGPTPPPEIFVRGAGEGQFLHFQVEDNGIGVEPEYAETVFGLFKRLHSREKYPGTGIGLAVCRRIIDQHGGKIWVEPGEAGGSVFHFTIQKGGGDEG